MVVASPTNDGRSQRLVRLVDADETPVRRLPIPESQLQIWSNQGAVASAKLTHESIRKALTDKSSPVADMKCEVYLQGSYKNDTNIRGDSDVDVVVQLDSSFMPDTSALPDADKVLYKSAFSDATYIWDKFKADVRKALRAYYGSSAVSEGRKALKIPGASGRLNADVLACFQYRKYLRFRSGTDQAFIEGVEFFAPAENRWIINFPKLHYENGVRKNAQPATAGMYKPIVRMFKNARTYLSDRSMIPNGLVASYFLECLLYNVSDSLFGTQYQQAFVNIVNWLTKADLSKFVCQNGQTQLFGNTPEQWSTSNADQLVIKLIELWNNW